MMAAARRRRGRPTKFITADEMAARRVLEDYEVTEPWRLLAGSEGQAAIDAAVAVEEVLFGDYPELADTMVLDANNVAFVFVRG